MTGDGKHKFNLRRLIGIVFSFASIAVLAYVAITLLSGNSFDLSWVSRLFSANEPVVMADEFLFDVGRDRVFADLGGAIAAAGTLGIQVFDSGGSETLREPFRMATPAISAEEGRAIAFDIGGTAIRVFRQTDILASIDTTSAIVSASINSNGWFCVCTQEGGGYKGSVAVYNNVGGEVYRVDLASGYVLSAALSPDNKYLAVLNLTGEGSRITFYTLSSESAESSFDLSGGLILDIRYLSDGELIAVSKDSLFTVDNGGKSTTIYDFSGKLLSGYAIGGDFIALHLLDYGIGYQGSLETFSADGKLLGEQTTDKEFISMSAGGGYLAVLRSDGLIFYNSALDEFTPDKGSGETAGATQVLALDGAAALVAGDHSAVVFKAQTES